jgi:hypothetical protein
MFAEMYQGPGKRWRLLRRHFLVRRGLVQHVLVFAHATVLDLDVAAPYAFTPSPHYPFQRILISCIRCYWLALIASLDDFEKNEMKERLNCLPPHGGRIPKFDGAKCVERPGGLNEHEYEGLMRIMHVVSLGMVPKDVVKTWYEIGEIGVQTWEEELAEEEAREFFDD